MKKIRKVLLKVFAVGILLCLLAGGISVMGYLAAIIVGGETATNMCAFIFKTYLPVVIKITSVCAASGLLAMYLGKEKSLTVK